MSELESLLHLLVLLLHPVVLSSLWINLLKVFNKLLFLSIFFSLLQLVVKFRLNLRYSAVFVLLSKQQVFHLRDLLISLLQLLWRYVLQGLKLHSFEVFF